MKIRIGLSVLTYMLCLVSLSACHRTTEVGGDTNADTQGSVDERELEATIRISVAHSHDYGITMDASAYFMDMKDYVPDSGVDGQFIYEEQGDDACTLFWESDEVAVGYVSDYLDAGDVALHIEDSTFPMTKKYINEEKGWIRYELWNDISQEPEWFFGKTVSASATGADAPAFITENLSVLIPDAHIVTNPAHESVLPKAAINLEWSGGSGGEALLWGIFFKKGDEGDTGDVLVDTYRMDCHVTDDGEFEFPAELVNLVPSGYFFDGFIVVRNETTHQVTPDYKVTIYATASSNFNYQLESAPTK